MPVRYDQPMKKQLPRDEIGRWQWMMIEPAHRAGPRQSLSISWSFHPDYIRSADRKTPTDVSQRDTWHQRQRATNPARKHDSNTATSPVGSPYSMRRDRQSLVRGGNQTDLGPNHQRNRDGRYLQSGRHQSRLQNS